MIRIRLIVLTALICTAALSATYAEHPGRPANVPKPEGISILYFCAPGGGDNGALEIFPGASVGAEVYGWSFDSQDPNSPFQASSPTIEDSDPNNIVSNAVLLLAYNESILKFNNLNKKTLEMNPAFQFGPIFFTMYDESRLEVTDSVIKTVYAEDHSNVKLTNTFLHGDVLMDSDQTMQLSTVKPFTNVFVPGNVSILANKGMTTIDTNSVITSVSARGSAIVTVKDSIVTEDVSTGGDLAGIPTVTLTNTNVGKLTAGVGTISMSGGQVEGVVEAYETGSIAVTGGVLKSGLVLATGNGTLSFTGTKIIDLSAGDSLNKTATINVTGGEISGNVKAVGGGVVNITGVLFIGNSQGTALQSHNNASVTVSGMDTIFGGVLADGDSSVNLGAVKNITGDLSVGGNSILDVHGTFVSGGVLASENATINIFGSNVSYTNARQVSTVNLYGADVTQTVITTEHGRSTFGEGSSARDIITTENGMITVLGGDIAGNLVGFGDSITAMSGGHVVGFPVFHGRAKFLYLGGTFDFFGIPQAGAAASLSGLGEGADDDPPPSQLPGFTILDDAEIQFIGFGLQSTLVNPNVAFGDFTYSAYQLTGRLADGSTIDGGLVYTQNFTGARFQLIEAPVPEPASWVLVLLAAGLAPRIRWRGR